MDARVKAVSGGVYWNNSWFCCSVETSNEISFFVPITRRMAAKYNVLTGKCSSHSYVFLWDGLDQTFPNRPSNHDGPISRPPRCYSMYFCLLVVLSRSRCTPIITDRKYQESVWWNRWSYVTSCLGRTGM